MKEITKKGQVTLTYKNLNEEVIMKVVNKEITIQEARREMDKILGITLVKLSELK